MSTRESGYCNVPKRNEYLGQMERMEWNRECVTRFGCLQTNDQRVGMKRAGAFHKFIKNEGNKKQFCKLFREQVISRLPEGQLSLQVPRVREWLPKKLLNNYKRRILYSSKST